MSVTAAAATAIDTPPPVLSLAPMLTCGLAPFPFPDPSSEADAASELDPPSRPGARLPPGWTLTARPGALPPPPPDGAGLLQGG